MEFDTLSRVGTGLPQNPDTTYTHTKVSEHKYKAPKTHVQEKQVDEQGASGYNINVSSHEKSDDAHDGKNSKDLLDKTINEANKKLLGTSRYFQYNVHEKTNQIMIKILDQETNEVIKEIPPEKTLDAIAKMWELAGILVDEKR